MIDLQEKLANAGVTGTGNVNIAMPQQRTTVFHRNQRQNATRNGGARHYSGPAALLFCGLPVLIHIGTYLQTAWQTFRHVREHFINDFNLDISAKSDITKNP